MQNAHADTTSPLFVVVFLYSRPTFILRCTQKAGQQQKNQPLLLSLGHGSNTITMVLPGPQGTVQYPIRAPDEHSLHTKIMEKSLALFFYCYQSVVHLPSYLSLTLLLSAPSSLFFCPFYPLSGHPCPLCRSHPLSCFPTLRCGVWFVGYKGRRVGFIHQSSVLSALVSPLFYPWAYSAHCANSHHWACIKKWCNGHQSQSRKKGSRIMKIIVRFV